MKHINNKSEGEIAYSNVFTFFPIVPVQDQEEVKDYLSKYAFNLSEAREYLNILKQVNALESSQKSELLYRIHAMSLQCFPLAIRRMVDTNGKRSIRHLINMIVNEPHKSQQIAVLNQVLGNYKSYIDRGVAHQDVHSMRTVLNHFPNNDLIEKDLVRLENIYLEIVRQICKSFINPRTLPHDYSAELNKLVTKEGSSPK